VFFVLSKTLGVALLPTNFLIGLGLVGVVLLLTRFSPAGRKLLVVAALGLAICGFSPLGNWLLYPLESRFPPWDASEGAPDGIIVLGGPIDPDVSAARKVPVIRNAPDRIVTAAILARKYPSARIIFTGGNADLRSNDAREADYAGDIFERLGVSKTRLTMERRSRNTFENAEFSKRLAAPKAGERWLLITSAYHMPRAVGLFRKVGFAVEPCPVDWRLRGREDLLSFSDLAIDGLEQTDIAMHEWIGLLAYRLAGKTNDLLPGPSRG
jgi:uncharacterized SAM-binding protein YcdF (DUF218 family)